MDQEITLHGHRVSYRIAGDGPLVLLIHGVTGTSQHWREVMPLLADRYTVLAPDLLGHGNSAKPRGDYSLGSFASGMRDMMVALGHERATVVGHSLGGGIAMQFAYQFPDRCERLVLVASGGLGHEVHLLLRAAALPGAELVLPLIAHERIRNAGAFLGSMLQRGGLRASADMAEMGRGYGSLSDPETRHAFLHTLRAVVDPRGQRVSALDRHYLAEAVPTLIVWGRRDNVIPVQHADAAQRAMPGSRLELFDDAGHFPQLEEPGRFTALLRDFIDTTEPAQLGHDTMAERLRG